jgi:hypothetical protein
MVEAGIVSASSLLSLRFWENRITLPLRGGDLRRCGGLVYNPSVADEKVPLSEGYTKFLEEEAT